MLDTHAWVWWLSLPNLLSRPARDAIERAEEIGVATISCWEVATLAQRDRMAVDRDVRDWVVQALARVEPLPLSAEVAVAAGLLAREEFPRDPADRIIYATAQAYRVPLITKDRRIRSFDPAGTVW